MSVRSTGEEAETQLAGGDSVQNLGERRGSVVVTHNQEVAALGVHGDPGMTEMGVNDSRLVLLVVVHPKLDLRLPPVHVAHGTTHRSRSKPGLVTGSEKQDRRLVKVGGVVSGNTTEK